MHDPGGALDTHMLHAASAAARAAMFARVRAELRAEHVRLTDRQIDLIADAAVELRLACDRLKITLSSSAKPTLSS
jgi:hypothetical protein